MKALLPPAMQSYSHKPVPARFPGWYTKTERGPWYAFCDVCGRTIRMRVDGTWRH